MEMLVEIRELSQLPYMRLMELYSQDLRESAHAHYPNLTEPEALFAAEQDFYTFLSDIFFKTPDARFYAWSVDGIWRSCLRTEPFEDGFLICGITTEPAYRRCGYASKLLRSVLQQRKGKAYSHVRKDNLPSVQLHSKSGFQLHHQWARMLNGEKLQSFCTFVYN